MTCKQDETYLSPVLALGVGNQLLMDDGLGLALLEQLRDEFRDEPRAEFIDGGTMGIALAHYLAGRDALLLLDAVALGAEPGTVHVVTEAKARAGSRGSGAHEGNVAELLAAATLIGECPESVTVVGIEPAEVRTGIGLSSAVERTLPDALEQARRTLRSYLAGR